MPDKLCSYGQLSAGSDEPVDPVGTIAPPVVKKKGEQRKKKEKETGGENFKKGKKRKIKRKKLNIDQERGCYTVGADGRY